ncbi:MAG: hypothetical protein A3F71_14565 [Burkholderiales bacterium RIFCSPLOWO2_12_FULL_64_33]|nr:MAG: hypothetical protein A3C40_22360 [Burkholderiales bacterium RIFCSPHIGHO2_02_FULL_64_19]OGB54660.1 MAG: hypothetical protein A3F71_14565 [Burkholderiales bacterium RIFCSPLOWO2_12_FULL_64_33]
MNLTTLTFIAAVASAAVTVASAAVPPASVNTLGSAIVVQDQASLRAAPRDGAQQQASLWQGEVLEVRGERLDYLQVWDHKRERGGFIRASDVRRMALTEAEGPALLAVLRFMQDTPGAEALGIGLTAAYLQAAPGQLLAGVEGAQAFDALGTFADRLARRASVAVPGKASGATLSAHLDVANAYGVRFSTYEVEGRMQVCYDGEAFRRVLAMPVADAAQRARAALALTRPECINPDLPAHERAKVHAWQVDVLERVDVAGLPPYLRNRVQMRRASVWGATAFEQARKNVADPAVAAAAARALTEFAGVSKADLPDEDQSAYNDAAMRVSAVRWALVPTTAPAAPSKAARPTLVTEPGAPGETCVLLVDAQHTAQAPLLRRCTYGVVWSASASTNREGTAVALAVQPLEGWRELWVLRKTEGGWLADVLPPAATTPETGVAEWAGWVPGGQQMLVAREARGQGRYRKSFEVVRLDGLTTERVTGDVAALPLFQRWQDPAWKLQTLSLR